MSRMDESSPRRTEDYLEMICRLSKEKGYTRVSELSGALNVQPPAATRMVQKLAEMKLIKYEKYGVLVLDEAGSRIGDYLLQRHEIIDKLLKVLGVSDAQRLGSHRKMEHTISRETLHCIRCFWNLRERIRDFLRHMRFSESRMRQRNKSFVGYSAQGFLVQ